MTTKEDSLKQGSQQDIWKYLLDPMNLFVTVFWLWIGIFSYHGRFFALFLLWLFGVFPTYCVRRFLKTRDPRSFQGRLRHWIQAGVFLLGAYFSGVIHDLMGSSIPGGDLERANYEAEIYVFVSTESSENRFLRVPAKIKRETPMSPFVFLIPRFLNETDMSTYTLSAIKLPGVGWTEVFSEGELLDLTGENYVFTSASDKGMNLYLTREAVKK